MEKREEMNIFSSMSTMAWILAIVTIALIGFWLFWLFGAMRSSQARKPIDNLPSDNPRFRRQSEDLSKSKDRA